jgi:hypothetical protein
MPRVISKLRAQRRPLPTAISSVIQLPLLLDPRLLLKVIRNSQLPFW